MPTIDGVTSRGRERERRTRRRRGVLRWAGGLLLLALVFFAGLVVGKAIEEPPAPGDQTLVRTLVPTTLAPSAIPSDTVSNR